MKTPEEIKRGMALCKMDECFGQHEDCPYAGEPSLCVGAMCDDGLAYIQQLEREKEAMMEYTHGMCRACKHFKVPITEKPCVCCKHNHVLVYSGGEDNWEWRGVEVGAE